MGFSSKVSLGSSHVRINGVGFTLVECIKVVAFVTLATILLMRSLMRWLIQLNVGGDGYGNWRK